MPTVAGSIIECSPTEHWVDYDINRQYSSFLSFLKIQKYVLEPWCSSYRHLVLQRVQFCYQYDESQQLVSDSFICIKGALYRHSK